MFIETNYVYYRVLIEKKFQQFHSGVCNIPLSSGIKSPIVQSIKFCNYHYMLRISKSEK